MNSDSSPRSYWPMGIMVFFACALVFLITFIFWAGRQREDLVAENYYDNEVRFQQRLDQLNRTQPLAAQLAVTYDAGLRHIVIQMPAQLAGQAVGQVRLYRPSDSRLDQERVLALNPDGSQRFDARSLPPGLWKVRVQWKAGGQDYFFDRPVVITSQS